MHQQTVDSGHEAKCLSEFWAKVMGQQRQNVQHCLVDFTIITQCTAQLHAQQFYGNCLIPDTRQ